MTVASMMKSYEKWADEKAPVINTLANHLIVVFSFSVPVLVEARRTSLVLLILLFLVRGRIYSHVRSALRDPVVRAFALYFLVHLVWMAGTDDAGRVGEVVHDAGFLLIPLLFSTFVDKRYAARIMAAFFLGMFASILISFGIFFELLPPMIHDGNQGDWKDPTPFYHHTHYGYMLALTAVYALGNLGPLNVLSRKNTAWLLLLILAVANIFIIAGRTGFVLLVILVPMLYLFIYRRKALVPLAVIAVALSVATVAAYKTSPTFSERVDTTRASIGKLVQDRDYYSSLGGRAAMVMISLDLAADHWLFGMGTADHTGEIQETIERDYSDLWFLSRGLAHPHNEYLNALLQFGVIGLVAFLNISFQLLRYKNEDRRDEILFGLIGISILLYTLQDVMVIDLGMLFTVVVLVSAGLREYSVENASYEKINIRQVLGYGMAMLAFYVIKQV